jgi:hypothetical protein
VDITVSKVFLSSDFSDNLHDNTSKSTDVIVVLSNGLKYAASFLPYAEIEQIRKRHLISGEFINGLYYWGQNMVLVKDCQQETVEKVVEHMIEEGDFQEAFRKL